MLTETKQAVESAIQYFREVLPAVDIRLEEIELSRDERYWNITLSGLIPIAKDVPPEMLTGMSAMAEAFQSTHERVYKVFVVEDIGCKVRSMKIRPLEQGVH